MSIFRWALSIVAFPIGGWIAFQLVGSVSSPLTAAAAGAVAGSIIGAAQGLALGRARGWRWLVGTAVGMSGGRALAVVLSRAVTTITAVVVTGAVVGAVVGVAQGLALRQGWRVVVAWAATISLSWATGWAITANVITDLDSGFITFGLSGALLVTIVTALVLRRILGPLTKAAVRDGATPATQPIAEPSR